MSHLLGFGATLLILALYFLGTFGLVVSIILILNKFIFKQEGNPTAG